jgi:hypothetical protein
MLIELVGDLSVEEPMMPVEEGMGSKILKA